MGLSDDGSQSRGYSENAGDTRASTAVQLMHRKPLMISLK
jgi:hypothetical protein